MAHLTADEKEAYRREGWVIPRWRLPKEKVDALRDSLDRLIAANPGVRPEKLVSAHIEGRNAEGVHGSRDFLDL
ncbi:MAG: phytanoyl-CoA dioxygenase family protein, partial [Alphaproteobacteria bacterium]